MNDHREAITVHDWVRLIKAEVGKTVETTLTIGRLLIEAKAALGHGQFEQLFVDLPFDIRQAEHYMSIAIHPVLTNPKYISLLPVAMSTLYVLSRTEPLRLEAALADGLIRPSLQRAEAHALFATRPIPPEWSLAEAEDRLRLAINREIDGAPPGSNHDIADVLRKLADEVDKADQPELRHAAAIAKEELSMRDAEPGGHRLFESAAQASTHAGAPTVIGGVKSTYPQWAKDLLTGKEGVTPLKRKQLDARVDDIEVGTLPTKRTIQTHGAVLWAIKDLARTSPLSRGIR